MGTHQANSVPASRTGSDAAASGTSPTARRPAARPRRPRCRPWSSAAGSWSHAGSPSSDRMKYAHRQSAAPSPHSTPIGCSSSPLSRSRTNTIPAMATPAPISYRRGRWRLGPPPMPADQQHRGEVLQQQRHPDRQVLHGVEVAELGEGDRHHAVDDEASGLPAVGRPSRSSTRRQGMANSKNAPPTRTTTTAAGDQPLSSKDLANGPASPKPAAEASARGMPTSPWSPGGWSSRPHESSRESSRSWSPLLS